MTKDQWLIKQRDKRLGKALKKSARVATEPNVDDTIHITIGKEKWENTWKSEEEFVRLIEDIAIEAAVKGGYAKDEQEAIRLLGYSRSTDGKDTI